METTSLRKTLTKSITELQQKKEQSTGKVSDNRKIFAAKHLSSEKRFLSDVIEDVASPPPQIRSMDKAVPARTKSMLIRRISKLETKDMHQPIEAMENFRTSRPSTYSSQVHSIQTSYIHKLTEVETNDRLRRLRTKSTFLEKESVCFEKIQESLQETKETYICSTSGKKKAKADISSPKDKKLDAKSSSSSKKKGRKNKVTVKPPDALFKSDTRVSSSKLKFVRSLTAGYEKFMSDQRKMLKVTTSLGLPSPEEMPAVALPILRKPLKNLKLREMAKLSELARRTESQLVRFYVEWAVDLQDDADISFFVDTPDLYGMHLRYEIASLYDVAPYVLLLRQTRGRRKSDGALVVMTVSCAFADLGGGIVMNQDVEQIKVHIIRDKETVPLPGEWRALIQALNVERPRLRREEKKRIRRLYEYAKKLRIRRNSVSVH